jgi:Na+-transporting methylmalonyl-CoA/oxaloacetate decarboxylase gamma subunit
MGKAFAPSRLLLSAFCFLLSAFLFNVFAEDEDSIPKIVKTDSYDPLIPQLFAFDKDNNVFAGINSVDNRIDLLRKTEAGDSLICYASYVVDIVKKRHDTHHIYRPKSVAIYEGYIVFLASHRDSCYLAVLDIDGHEVKKMTFEGEANAFSFSYETQELYIAGETAEGYDIVALDASHGLQNIDMVNKNAAKGHYRKPKMSEKIAIADPWGVGMASIAMSVVFLGLLLLYLVFKNVGNTLIFIQKRRTILHRLANIHLFKQKTKVEVEAITIDDSGEVYAAITAAIHLFNEELNDEENTVLTINKVSRTYSPWSSKIHGLNTYFNLKR